jgi:DNA-binding response OmpR family regulator
MSCSVARIVGVDGRQPLLLVDPAGPAAMAPVLARCGFEVVWSPSAERSLFDLGQRDFGAVVAALPLIGLGIAGLCQQIRQRGPLPVLVVTRDDDADWLAALAAGADDHLRVPCDERELTARLTALIRRVRGPLRPARVVQVGALIVRLRHDCLTLEPALALTPVQRSLLAQLADQRGVVLSDRALADGVRAAHGATDFVLDAEMRALQDAVAAASGVEHAVERIDGMGWRIGGE